MHQNIFLNTVHEQAIESDEYINTLETCLKNHWFDSLYPKYWVRFSLLFTKPMFQKYIQIKIDQKKGRRMINKRDSQQK